MSAPSWRSTRSTRRASSRRKRPRSSTPSPRRIAWSSMPATRTFTFRSLTGFGDLELKDIMADRTGGLTDPDDAPAAPEHPVSQTGDLWLLGRHRLLCGDSTVATDVARVL